MVTKEARRRRKISPPDGATNAGLLAVQILALGNETLAQKLTEYKSNLEEVVAEKSRKVSAEITGN